MAARPGRDIACRKRRNFGRGLKYALLSVTVSGPLHIQAWSDTILENVKYSLFLRAPLSWMVDSPSIRVPIRIRKDSGDLSSSISSLESVPQG
jgi:hypothetical protein